MCNNDSNCIADVLKVICVLQRNADCGEACLDTCDRGFLGSSVTNLNINTRPISLYLCGANSTPLAMPISKDPTETDTSTVFRVEKCDEGCATFRVLAPNTDPDTSATIPFVSTNSFFTVNLSCVCVLRCLNDTVIENI
ncbi:MAG: hypothetical protein J6G98_05475 [Bacilli bacterium]|nr:hypothetical protein [Bacilli bacterium]